jgi:Spy/CpxP family protein refolding chaperone
MFAERRLTMAASIFFHLLETNMNSIRKLLAVTVLATGALLTAGAGISVAGAADDAAPTAAPPGQHGWHHHGGAMHLYSKLGLSDAQKAQIKTIMQSAGPQMKTLHQQMRDNQLKLHQIQPTDPNYDSVVSEVSQANGTLHGQMAVQMAGVRKEIFTKVLTASQQTQLQQLEAQMQARMQARHPAT